MQNNFSANEQGFYITKVLNCTSAAKAISANYWYQETNQQSNNRIHLRWIGIIQMKLFLLISLKPFKK